MFVRKSTFDAMVADRDRTMELVEKLRLQTERQREAIATADVTIGLNEMRNTQLLEVVKSRYYEIATLKRDNEHLKTELSRSYVRNAAGQIARHPSNVGGAK